MDSATAHGVKLHCILCGKVMCEDLDGTAALRCPVCKCDNVVGSFRVDGIPGYIVWQIDTGDNSNIYSYARKCISKIHSN